MIILGVEIPVLDFLVLLDLLMVIYIFFSVIELKRLNRLRTDMYKDIKELHEMLSSLASHSVVFWVLDQLEEGVSEEVIRRKLLISGYPETQHEAIISKARILQKEKQDGRIR